MLLIPLPEKGHSAAAPISRTLVVACGMVWIATVPLRAELQRLLAAVLGVVPAWVVGADVRPDCIVGPPIWMLPITASLLHVELVHVLLNGLWLWVFGPRVEMSLGPLRFALFVVASAYASLLFQAVAIPQSGSVIGASGIVAGILGAYAFLHPKDNVRVGLPALFHPFPLPGILVAGLWLLLQLVQTLDDLTRGGTGGVAYGAHLSGFLFGIGFAATLRPRGTPWFDLKRPWRYENPFEETEEPPRRPWSFRRILVLSFWALAWIVAAIVAAWAGSRLFRRLLAASVC
jgi:membrane associated rhomboid family serine protease